MKKKLIYYLFITLSIFVNTCSDGFKEEATESYKSNIYEVTAITSPTRDTTPDYVFYSNMAGTITYGGSCSSSTTSAISGNNTITLASLSDGTYSDCTITVTNQQLNLKYSLTITSFTVVCGSCVQMGGSIQGAELSLTTKVTTFAGTGSSGSTDHTTATLASFNQPFDITTDGTNLYVIDSPNHKIRQVVISTGEVTTLAGTGSLGSTDHTTGTSAEFNYPKGITTDGTNLYVADSFNHLIRQIGIDNRSVTTLAGSGSFGSSNGVGTSAEFKRPYGITTDGTNLYVADTNSHTIRKIGIDNRSVTTLAGTVGSSGSANGVGTSASFYFPMGITTDGTNLYVADKDNDLIRQIVISTKAVTTLAGGGSGVGTDGTGTTASFNYPTGITTDGTNLYVADHDNHLIRQIVISTKAVTTLAGDGSQGSTDHATGTSASFNDPTGITTDGTNLYVAEHDNHLIRQIVISTGEVTTLAGRSSGGGSAIDDIGTAARFRVPTGITTDGRVLYVIGKSNHVIRKIE